jgi:glycosyltransferase involved in cell wall biosynthesis
MGSARAVHVVQIGYDDTVFASDGRTDTLTRQEAYARELAHRHPGSIVTLIVLTRRREAREVRAEGVRFIPLHYHLRAKIPWLAYRALEDLHRERSLDLVTTQTVHEEGLGALCFGARRGIPVVGQIHYDLFSRQAQRENLGNGLRGRVRWLAVRKTIGRYQALRVVGKRIAARILESGMHRNVHVLPVYSSMLALAPETGGPRIGKGTVLFVGRLAAQKRLDVWLQTARAVLERVPDARFVIAGSGPLRPWLERVAAELGVQGQVEFLGHVPYERLDALYRDAGVLLLTSSYEGFGRVLVEAAHHGVPAVATRVAGAEDVVVDGETGFLAEPGDVGDLAGKVVALLQDPARAREMGQAARRHVLREFEPGTLVRRWVELWLAAVASFPARRDGRT